MLKSIFSAVAIKNNSKIALATESVILWTRKLSKVNTEGVEMLVNPIEIYEEEYRYREDVASDGITKEVLTDHTSCRDNGFFIVPKIIKR